MTKQEKDTLKIIQPSRSNPEKRGISYGIVAIAYVAGLLSGVLLTIYKTGDAPPADMHQHVAQKTSSELSDRMAELEFKTAQNPTDIAAWIQLGNVCFDADLPDKSIVAYDKALALNPNNADVWTDQGVMYRKIGKYDKAIQCFDKAISVDLKHEIARFNKGIVLMHELNDLKGAMLAWEDLLAVNPLAMAPNGQSIDEMIRKMKQR